MKKEQILEQIKEEIRNIVTARKEGHLTQQEYVIKMNAYNEIVKAIM